jgi:hypothetical protein
MICLDASVTTKIPKKLRKLIHAFRKNITFSELKIESTKEQEIYYLISNSKTASQRCS